MNETSQLSSKPSYKELEEQNSQLIKQVNELKDRLSHVEFVSNVSQEDNNMGTWEVDLINNKQIWSENYCKLLGYSEIIKEPSEDLFFSHLYKEDLELVKNTMQTCISSKSPCSLEFRYLTKDGQLKYAKSTANYLFDDEKNITRIIGVFQDITDRIEATNKLKNNETKYRALYDNAPLSYQSLDINGNFIDINPTWLSTLGYEKEEVIGKNYGDFLHPDWKKHFEINFPAFKKRGYVSDVQFKIRHKNGHYLYISFEGCIGTHPDGSFKQTYCVFKDITEQKLVEDSLVKNQFYLSKAQEIGKIGTWELDILNNKLTWTRQNYENFGLKQGTKLTYETFVNCIHPEDRDYVNQQWVAAMEGEPYEIEHRIIINGETRWLREKADVKFNKNGKAVSAIGFSQDITNEKINEIRLKEQAIFVQQNPAPVFRCNYQGEIVSFNLSSKKIIKKIEVGKSINLILHNFSTELVLDCKEENYQIEENFDKDSYLFTVKNEHTTQTLYFFGSNITAKKQTEIKLKESEERFQLAMQASQNGLFDWNLVTNEIYYSPGWKKMLGYEEHELPNDFSIWENLTEPEDVKKSWKLQQELVNKKIDRFELEFKMKHKKGHWINVLSKAEAIFNEKEEAVRIVGTHTDITEKNETLLKLKESEAKFKSYIKNAPDGIFIANEKGEYIEVNKAACRITGYSEDELLNLTIPELFQEEYLEKAKNHFQTLAKVGFSNSDVGFITKSGEKRFWNVDAVKLSDTRFLGFVKDITERKQTEQALQESEEQIRFILKHDPNAIAVFDNNMNILHTSERFLKDYDAEGQDIIGENLYEVFPELPEKWRKAHKKALEGEVIRNDDDYFIRPDGSTTYTRWECRPWYHANGEIGGMIAYTEVITERKQAEKDLIAAKEKAEQNEQKFRLLNGFVTEMLLLDNENKSYEYILESLQKYYPNTIAIIVSVDEKNVQTKLEAISGFNNKLLNKTIEITGFNPIGKTYKLTDFHKNYLKSGELVVFDDGLAEFSSPEFPSFAAKALEKLIGLHKIYSIGINKDDELLAAVHLFTSKMQVIDDKNFIEVLVKQAGLVLQKKRYEKELQDAKEIAESSKANITAIIEGNENSIWAFNRDYELLYVNHIFQQEFLQSFGVNLKTGVNLVNALPSNLRPLWKSRYDRVLNNEQFIMEDAVPTNNGTVYIEVSFNPIVKNGKVVGGSCFGSNITPRKLSELELLKAKEKAEESDRLKTAFLANMSHEIRTPMNGILGFTELLQEADLSVENQQDYIHIIKKSGERLLNTVNDIVEISKIESGQIVLTKSEVDIISHIKTHLTFFKPEADKKGLNIIMQNDLKTNSLSIITDKTKLSSILSNLIKNAIKYSNFGTIKVGVSLCNDELLLTCQDNGIGIPKHRQEAIFNRFEQADIEDKRVHEGSGLGLAIVKSYVEMLGGKIWVESDEGQGSTFYVTLTHNSSNNSEQQTNIEFKTGMPGLKNISVLIVEDDEISSMYIGTILEGIVKKRKTVVNGIDAIDACKKDTDFDLILMDIKMPGIDGYEATRRIREFNSEVIIIAQTAFAFEEDKQKAINAGCNDFISKPIKRDELIKIINKYISQ